MTPETFCPFPEPAAPPRTDLVGQWTKIAREVAQHCRHRARGQCLANCRGLAVCDITGLHLINHP